MRISAFCALLFLLPASAQFRNAPSNGQLGTNEDAAVPPPAPVIGKGAISGSVINAKTSEPVKKARVTLGGAVSLSAVTDGSGTFTFRALPPGGYMVMANHDDFYVNPASMGAAQQMNLNDGEDKQGVQIKLMPGATISGRVLDDDESPVPNCLVSAIGSARSRGRMRPRSNNGANTDDQGRFRLHGLQQGHYSLVAQCGTTFPAPHGFMKRNDPLIPREGYAPVALGGDSNSPTAGLAISAGADLTGVDFHVKRVPVFVVRGSLSGADASLLRGAQIMLTAQDVPGSEDNPFHARYDPAKDQFMFQHVPAGTYEITAMVFNADRAYEARENVEVGKTQVTDVDLKFSPSAVLAGRIDFDDPTLRFDNMQISLQPLASNYRGPYPMSTIGADGSFELKSVLPGSFRLNPLPMGYVKSMTLAGQDVSPLHFTVAGSSAGPLHIFIGSKMAKVEVELSPRPDAGVTVSGLLIPADQPDTPDGRNMAVSPAGGELSFANVAPGKYRVFVAVTNNIWNLMNEPDALKALESHTVPVEVAEGDDKHVSASVISADDLQKALDATE